MDIQDLAGTNEFRQTLLNMILFHLIIKEGKELTFPIREIMAKSASTGGIVVEIDRDTETVTINIATVEEADAIIQSQYHDQH